MAIRTAPRLDFARAGRRVRLALEVGAGVGEWVGDAGALDAVGGGVFAREVTEGALWVGARGRFVAVERVGLAAGGESEASEGEKESARWHALLSAQIGSMLSTRTAAG